MLENKLMTPGEVAAHLHISVKTLRDHFKAGEIAGIVMGRGKSHLSVRYRPEDVQAFIDQRRTVIGPPSPSPKRNKLPASSYRIIDFNALLEKRKKPKP